MKTTWVSDLNQLGAVEGVFLIAEAEVKVARDDNPYIKMRLQDRTGAIEAMKWRATDREQEIARSATHVEVSGRLEMYQGRPQLQIDKIWLPAGKIDPEDFLPRSSLSVEQMQREIAGIIQTIDQPHVRKLLEMATGPETDTGRAFAEAPGAIRVHHAYLGGLIEHTLSAVKLAEVIAGHYPDLNRDLLVAGTMLHDIGKTQEYTWKGSLGQSDEGQLIGHITQGVILVDRLIEKIKGFDPTWRLLLLHMIISHHGKMEYGSPKVPAFPEAIALHYIEDMDAKLQIAEGELTEQFGQRSSRWTKRSGYLDTALFRGVPPPVAHETPRTAGEPPPPEAPGDLFSALEDEEDPFAD